MKTFVLRYLRAVINVNPYIFMPVPALNSRLYQSTNTLRPFKSIGLFTLLFHDLYNPVQSHQEHQAF